MAVSKSEFSALDVSKSFIHIAQLLAMLLYISLA